MAPEKDFLLNLCILAISATGKGIARYACSLANALTTLNSDLHITLIGHPDLEKFGGPVPKSIAYRVFPFRNRLARLFFMHLIFPFAARRYDLVHSIGNIGLLFGNAPQVITIHDSYEHRSPERYGPIKRLLMHLMIARSGKLSEAVISVSKNTARDIARFYPHLRHKTRVIYSGCDMKRSPASVMDNRPFLFVGAIEPGKDLATILRALALFRKCHSRLLHVIGARGWRQAFIPELIHSLDLQNAVIFKGFISKSALIREYAAGQALLFASRYEGFGLPVLEALACGCPVIAANNSAIPEAGGDAALYFETGNPDDLAQKMRKIETSSRLRNALCAKGQRHADRFTWNRCATQTCSVYSAAQQVQG